MGRGCIKALTCSLLTIFLAFSFIGDAFAQLQSNEKRRAFLQSLDRVNVEVAIISEGTMDFKMITYVEPHISSFVLVVKKLGAEPEYYRKRFLIDYNEDTLEYYYQQELSNLGELIGTPHYQITEDHGLVNSRQSLENLGFDLDLLDALAEDEARHERGRSGCPDFDDPLTRQYEEALDQCLADNGQPPRDPPNCKNCNMSGISGYYHWEDKIITICMDTDRTGTDFTPENTYQHELVHAYDDCMDNIDTDDGDISCAESIETEINAYYCQSGACGPDSSIQECCRRVRNSSAFHCWDLDDPYGDYDSDDPSVYHLVGAVLRECVSMIQNGEVEYPPTCPGEENQCPVQDDQDGQRSASTQQQDQNCQAGGPEDLR